MNLADMLESLKNLSLKINPKRDGKIEIDLAPLDINIDIPISTPEGISVSLDEVEIDPRTKVWTYKGRNVLLFIPDQGFNFDDVMSGGKEGRKFHLSDCSTIEHMKQENRFARYQATNSTEGIFKIHGVGKYDRKPKSGETQLHVCIRCLKHLNYKRYNNVSRKEQKEIYRTFDLNEFFSAYKTGGGFSKEPPNIGQDQSGYAGNWDQISQQYRQHKDWTCEECDVNLTNHRQLLDVHHIDGVKHHNHYSNLKALCKECHSKQPFHSHYLNGISKEALTILRNIKKEQGII